MQFHKYFFNKRKALRTEKLILGQSVSKTRVSID